MAKMKIHGLSAETREHVRCAVGLVMAAWPNAHLGDRSPLEDMRSAFRLLRRYASEPSYGLSYGIMRLELDAYAHSDM